MSNATDWQLQIEEITRLQAQQHYAEAEALCTQLLWNLPLNLNNLASLLQQTDIRIQIYSYP